MSSEPTGAPPQENLRNVFSFGTLIGQPSAEITASQLLGRPASQIFAGRYNVPDALRYWESFSTSNPYMTEVGFFGGGKSAAYFLLSKMSNVRGQEFSDAEVESCLYRFARGGKWTTKPSKDADYKGTFYEYTHDYQVDLGGGLKPLRTFRLYAYRIQSKYSLVIYSPIVAIDLDGTSAAPAVHLAFAGGMQMNLSGPLGNNVPHRTIFIDQAPPDDLDPNDTDLSAVSRFLQEDAKSVPAYEFSQEEFYEFTGSGSPAKAASVGGKSKKKVPKGRGFALTAAEAPTPPAANSKRRGLLAERGKGRVRWKD
jgi:hypothetical protein